MEFNPPATNDDGLGDEETMPLDGGVASPGGDADEGAAHASDHDEDLDA